MIFFIVRQNIDVTKPFSLRYNKIKNGVTGEGQKHISNFVCFFKTYEQMMRH